MNSPLRIRRFTPPDLPFGDRVRQLAGWNQTPDDWQRFMDMEPDGCFLAEWNGAPAGTATTTVYGTALAWIGMVLVHPDYRRRGIGRALLDHCLDSLRRRSVQSIKLDATPLGKTVYDNLGFRAEWTLARWTGRVTRSPVAEPHCSLRPWREGDMPWIESLDAAAFGISRRRLLAALAVSSLSVFVVETSAKRIAGFGFLRPGSQAVYLGPVVAESDQAGRGLLEGLLAECQGKKVYWDIPDPNITAVAWAKEQGLTVQRPLIRMYLGENLAPGDPGRQFAISGPETG